MSIFLVDIISRKYLSPSKMLDNYNGVILVRVRHHCIVLLILKHGTTIIIQVNLNVIHELGCDIKLQTLTQKHALQGDDGDLNIEDEAQSES